MNISKLLSLAIVSLSLFTLINIDVSGAKEVKEVKGVSNIKQTYTSYESLVNNGKMRVIMDNGFSIEGDYVYFYEFQGYSTLNKDTFGYSGNSFNQSFKGKNTVLVKLPNNTGYGIVVDFKKTKMFNVSIIKNVKNKDFFFKLLSTDIGVMGKKEDVVKHLYTLLKVSESVKGVNENDTIEKSYKYVLDNVSYFTGTIDTNTYKNNKSLYSGINTLVSKKGVCEGYSKMFSYLLVMNGITDVQKMDGYVINTVLYPQFGHTWVKVSGKYYDVTFDDPINGTKTREKSNWMYFALPTDIMYLDRYDGYEIKKEHKGVSYKEFDKIVKEKTMALSKKYGSEGKKYNLLKPFSNIIDLGIDLGIEKYDNITFENIKDKFPTFEIKNGVSMTKVNGTIVYYPVQNNSLAIANYMTLLGKEDIYIAKGTDSNGNLIQGFVKIKK